MYMLIKFVVEVMSGKKKYVTRVEYAAKSHTKYYSDSNNLIFLIKQ